MILKTIERLQIKCTVAAHKLHVMDLNWTGALTPSPYSTAAHFRDIWRSDFNIGRFDFSSLLSPPFSFPLSPLPCQYIWSGPLPDRSDVTLCQDCSNLPKLRPLCFNNMFFRGHAKEDRNTRAFEILLVWVFLVWVENFSETILEISVCMWCCLENLIWMEWRGVNGLVGELLNVV